MMTNKKIVDVINKIIMNTNKITHLTAKGSEYFFLYKNKYIFSIKPDYNTVLYKLPEERIENTEYILVSYVNAKPSQIKEVIEAPSNFINQNIRSIQFLETPEIRDSLKDLYISLDRGPEIEAIFNDIIK